VVVEADPSQIDNFNEQVVEQVEEEADLSQIDNFQEQVVEEQQTVELVVEQVLVVGG
jgi:hypothetical protein